MDCIISYIDCCFVLAVDCTADVEGDEPDFAALSKLVDTFIVPDTSAPTATAWTANLRKARRWVPDRRALLLVPIIVSAAVVIQVATV